MPRETSTQVVSAFVAAIEARTWTALALVTEDVVYDNVPLCEVRGPDGIRAALARILTSAERIEWLVHHQVGEADVAMNERLDRFLVAGWWIEVPVAGLFVLCDGRIALWRDYFDAATYRRPTASSE